MGKIGSSGATVSSRALDPTRLHDESWFAVAE
jgi:hypothetical protein